MSVSVQANCPALSDHIKQDMFLAFQTSGCLLLYKNSMSFRHYFDTAIEKTPVYNDSMSLELMVALNRFNRISTLLLYQLK